MAPRPAQKGPPPATDGAPPGSEQPRTPGDKHAFDADGYAKAREEAPVTIGEIVFHRRRKSWQVTREMRNLLRTQERASGKGARLRARVDALTEQIRGVQNPQTGKWDQAPTTDEAVIDRIEGEIDALNDEIDASGDEADHAAYELIALLLRDDKGDQPNVDHLKESLDMEDAGELAARLAGGGEENPTQETPSS